MSMIVKNNIGAQKTLNTLNKNTSELQKSLEKVASGQKINSAKDDAASFAISEKMREQIRSLDQANANTQNASSMLKVAEGAVDSTVQILRTIKEKAVNAANDTNTDQDRIIIQKEINQFIDQVNDNALVTFNSKYLLDGSTSTVVVGEGASDDEVDEDARTFIIKGLSSEWVQSALNLIDESFGIGFNDTNGANAGVKEISVHFEDDANSGNLAYVTHSVVSGGKTNLLELHVNMAYYNNLDTTDVNGYDTVSNQTYLDRTLAHEFVHAAMAANITDFDNLPKWFKEGGTAELVHGIDDGRAGTMVNLLQNPTTLEAVLNGTNDDGDNAYAAGYMVMRYMTKTTVENTTAAVSQVDVAKILMQALANTSGNADDFDKAIKSASTNNFTFTSKDDLITKFMNVVATTGGYDLTDVTPTSFNSDTGIATFSNNSAMAFLKDKFGIDTQYYGTIGNTKTKDPDTGAITGSDAGGATSKNAEDIVPENTTTDQWSLPTSESSTYSGLTVYWPDGYTTEISSDGNSYTYGTLRMTDKKLKIQVGIKANQATNVGLYDMRAKSLGTLDLINTTKSVGDEGYFVHKSDEDRYNALSYDTDKQAAWLETLTNAQNKTLKDISVVTKDDANIAIRVIDGAIEYALNQQTDIGAYLQRFEYTAMNVTTMTENTQASESIVRDADMAKEMTAYTKNNVLMQAAQSMLAQANQSSSQVLSLLQ